MKNIILIDFDGVIRHWRSNPIETTEKNLDLPSGTLFSVAFSSSQLLPAITGQQSHANWVSMVRERLSNKFDAAISDKLIDAWESTTAMIDHDFIKSIRLISPNSKLVLVTNATDKLLIDICDSNLEGSFDLIVNSSNILVAKPEAEFFIKSIELVGCNFNHCVFIDDTLENVRVAQELGIQSLHHTSVNGTLEFINRNCK